MVVSSVKNRFQKIVLATPAERTFCARFSLVGLTAAREPLPFDESTLPREMAIAMMTIATINASGFLRQTTCESLFFVIGKK